MGDVPAPNYAAFQPDPLGQMAKGSAYVNSLFDRARQTSDQRAQDQAGGQYAGGDYSGASQTLARAGNIPAAAQVQQQGQAANSAGIQYLAKALPVFQKIVEAHAPEGPQGQAAALTSAFDQIAPEAKQLTGISDQALQSLRQGFATDPTGTIQRLQAMIPTEWKSAGDSLFGVQGNNVVSQIEGSKTMATQPGGGISQIQGGPVPVGGAQQPTTPAPPQPQGSGVLPGVDPAAVAKVESNGNPNAISPAGATGTMQTMPGTLQDPGYGVAPAQNGSPQEQTRVGQDYVKAMTAKYGPAIGLVAYNMGPGATDKWLADGGNFSHLPDETQKYIGRVAVQEAMSRRGAQQQQPQAGPAPQAPQGGPGSVRVLQAPSQIYRDATPDEAAKGIRQVNSATGEQKMEPVSMLPPDQNAVQKMAKAIANYQLPPMTGYALRSPQGQATMAAVMDQNPQYQAQNYTMSQDAYKKFGTGKQGDTVRALNTWVQHAQVLTDAAKALNNGNTQVFNRISNWWAQQTGSPLPTDFKGVATIYNTEGVKAILGANGALGDRDKFDGAMSSASSPAQIAGITNRYTQLASGQLNSLRRQYEHSTMRKDFDTLLAPETVVALEKHGRGANGAANQAPKIRTYNPATGSLE